MNRSAFSLRSLISAGILAILVCSPLALVSTVNAGTGISFESPSKSKSGAGLVLLVALQRG
jgi:hypothetical protein